MDNIILYSTHCPLCKGLEQLLKTHNINYVLCTDEDKMRALGIKQVPMLSVNNNLLTFPQASKWVLGVK